MIETDGVACSILWVRRDVIGKRFKPKLTPFKEAYIDEIHPDHLQGKSIVGIDPNKSDLIFCSTKRQDESIQKFRYTQDQKRKETKDKKYRNLRDELKTTVKVDGKTPQEWETELSNFNRKSLQVDVFKQYLSKKNEVNSKLLSFYEGRIFRKLKWNTFMNRKRSEHKMLHRFRSTFGTPEEVIIGFGDWEQRKQMKFKEPTKGKGMRELFRKAGYEVYLVDEFRTSCRCHRCEGACTTFRECPNPRPWKKNETTLRHGLLMCKTCTGLWNRDVNSSLNIHRVVEHHTAGKGRPEYLSRQQSVSATTSVVHNHILHEDAKPQHWNGEMCD
jgi:transposase